MLQKREFIAALTSLSCLFLQATYTTPSAIAAADSPVGAAAADSDDRKEIDKLLSNFEREWNAHNLEAVMSFYADDYVNNDGFDKKTVQKLMDELWKTYPDIKSSSVVKQVRTEGPYATVESKDEAIGSTTTEIPGLGTKGELRSNSEGQLYLKKVGPHWKILGDRVDYEKIKVSYGLGRQLEPTFGAPEQVKSGRQFTAKLEVELPTGLAATGSISQSPVSYPLPKITDKYKQIGDAITERPLLERVMVANSKNRNELLMATIVLTNASGNSIMGVVMLTRRLNVIPVMEEEPKAETTASSEKAKEAATEKEKPASGK